MVRWLLIQAAKAAGLSDAVIKDALSKMGDAVVKDRLKSVTQEALDHGVCYSSLCVHCVISQDLLSQPICPAQNFIQLIISLVKRLIKLATSQTCEIHP